MRESLNKRSPRSGAGHSPGHADNRFHHTSHQVFLATVLAVVTMSWVHGVVFTGGAFASHASYVGLDMLLALPFAGAAVWAGTLLARRFAAERGLLGHGLAVAATFTVALVPLGALQSAGHAVFSGGAGAGAHVATTEPLAMLGQGLTIAAMSWPAVLGAALLALYVEKLATDRRELRWFVAKLRALPRPLLVAGSSTALVAGVGAFAILPASPAAAQAGSCDTAPQRVYDVHAINVEITVNRHGDNDPWGYMYVLEDNLAGVRAEEQANRVASETGTRLDEDGGRLTHDPDWAEMVYDNPDARFVSHGLRDDLIQPLVLRARLGECVVINLTNSLERAPVNGVSNNNARLYEFPGGVPDVSIDMAGVAYDAGNGEGGQQAGDNAASMVAPGNSGQYRFFLDPDMGEGTKAFRSGGESTQLTAHGLFGALLAEPANARWFDPYTGEEKTNDSGWSNWEAMIQPNDGQPTFREFAIIYHEIGDENFSLRRPIREGGLGGGGSPRIDPFDPAGERLVGGALPMLDVQAPAVAGGELQPFFRGAGTKAYRPGSRALNYRSESFLRRLQHEAIPVAETTGDPAEALQRMVDNKAMGYSSYVYGDPATPMPRSYLGEPTKSRLAHLGFEQLHIHHLHGGATRWRQNPGADDTAMDAGLDKRPIQDAKSIRLDSQTISPEESFSLEHECGAGGCQQAAGDFLYHCHIAHHYIAGMWSFWRVHDTAQPDLAPLPGASKPDAAVNSAGLLGRTMPDGRTVVLDSQVTNPNTQIGLETMVEAQLPAQGARLDFLDATVWDWLQSGPATAPVYVGEPEDTRIWENYRSPTPGQRPEILFNPDNGRPTFPMLKPHLSQRPPFAPNEHSGAPWLGEDGSPGRPDGLCPQGADVREFDITSVSVDIPFTDREVDEGGMLYTLNEDLEDLVNGNRPADPLVIRTNVGDCADITFGNLVDNDGRAADDTLDQLAKVNMHTHFVQFDPQASDGVITGFSWEQSIFPAQEEGRTLSSVNSSTSITVNHVDRLRPGIAIAIGIGTPQIEIRTIQAINGTTITLDRALENNHQAGEWVSVEFTRHRWYSDVDSGTVFWHDHVDGIISWAHGLFAAHIIEPAGSTYHDPVTGQEVRSGTIVDIRNSDPNASVGVGQSGSFREFMIFLHNGRHASQAKLALGGQLNFNVNQECEEASINLRAEPLGERTPAGTITTDPGDPARAINVDPTTTDQRFEFNGAHVCRTGFDRTAPHTTDDGTVQATVTTVDPYAFSSVKYGEPATPLLRAYVGDDVVIRTIGLSERAEALRFQGHQFRMERFHEDSRLIDAAVTGISERFDYVLNGGAGGPAGKAGDYLYHSTRPMALETGGWGIFRVHDTAQNTLQPLPDNPVASGNGFPRLSPHTASNPQANPGPNPPAPSSTVVSDNSEACPQSGQFPRIYSITAFDHPLPTAPFEDTEGVVFALTSDVADIRNGVKPVEPLVLRANEGDCVVIRLRNRIDPNPLSGSLYGGTRAGLDLGQLARNPQLSGGAAIGLNPDTTVASNGQAEYRFLAGAQGSSIFTNLGSVASIRHGAYGMFIVEPAGSTWTDSVTGQPLSGTHTTTSAIIDAPGERPFREFALTLHTTDLQYARSVVPYVDTVAGSGINSPRDGGGDDNVVDPPIPGAPPGTEDSLGNWDKAFTHVSYHSEPLTARLGLTRAPGHIDVDGDGVEDNWWNAVGGPQFQIDRPYGTVFASAPDDPDTPTFLAHAGDRVVFRAGVGGSDQLHSFTVSGHSFPLEPFMDGAQQMSSRTLTTYQTLDMYLVGSGPNGETGDYTYRDSRQPFAAAGLWGIFRVLPDNQGGIVPIS